VIGNVSVASLVLFQTRRTPFLVPSGATVLRESSTSRVQDPMCLIVTAIVVPAICILFTTTQNYAFVTRVSSSLIHPTLHLLEIRNVLYGQIVCLVNILPFCHPMRRIAFARHAHMGFFSDFLNVEECSAWSSCQPGTHVLVLPSLTEDIKCRECDEGQFTDRENMENCTDWTTCDADYFYVQAVGRNYRDRNCTAKPPPKLDLPTELVFGDVPSITGISAGALPGLGEGVPSGFDSIFNAYETSCMRMEQTPEDLAYVADIPESQVDVTSINGCGRRRTDVDDMTELKVNVTYSVDVMQLRAFDDIRNRIDAIDKQNFMNRLEDKFEMDEAAKAQFNLDYEVKITWNCLQEWSTMWQRLRKK